MEMNSIVMTAVLLIYNGATIRLLTVVLKQTDIAKAVQEKSASSAPVSPEQAINETSYSRVAGMIGATVMAAFFWAIGNVILYKAFIAPSEIGEILSNLSTYFLGASSLFMPYAFNQLRATFAPG